VTAEVSALVVNWNTRELVLRCLDSIGQGIGQGITFETIVVDNGSLDGSVEALRERKDVVLVENAENLGFAAAVNQAYRLSSGDYVLLLNSDVELLPGALEALVEFLRRCPDVAGVAPLYRNPDGSEQPFHFRFPTLGMTLANGSALIRRLPTMKSRLRRYRMLDDDFSKPRRVDQPSASCLLLRRTCLPPTTILDERYPIFFNDVQLARALAYAGHQLWVTPAAVVVHVGHASTSLLGGALKRQYVGSIVQMLRETEPAMRVLVYQALVFVQGLGLLALRRRDAMSFGDLLAAVKGDPGPIPSLSRVDVT
jgi:GT2 family glycosyltransferase